MVGSFARSVHQEPAHGAFLLQQERPIFRDQVPIQRLRREIAEVHVSGILAA